jgi:membrane dipeptidase
MMLEKEWAAKIPRPPFKSLIDHINHMVEVAGVEHVGLGSDFDGVAALPEGMNSVADLPKITQALVERGYSAVQIHKILGENLLRVMRECEQIARQLQKEKALGPQPLSGPEVVKPR